jgi:hypothetical protein
MAEAARRMATSPLPLAPSARDVMMLVRNPRPSVEICAMSVKVAPEAIVPAPPERGDASSFTRSTSLPVRGRTLVLGTVRVECVART